MTSRQVADRCLLAPLGCQPGVHRAGDSDDGLAGEDAEAARGIFGRARGRRGRSDPGKAVGEGAWLPGTLGCHTRATAAGG